MRRVSWRCTARRRIAATLTLGVAGAGLLVGMSLSLPWTVLVTMLFVVAVPTAALIVAIHRRDSLALAMRRLEAEVIQRERGEAVSLRFAALGAELASTLDPVEVGQRVVSAVAELCGSRRTVLYQLQNEPNRLTPTAAQPPDELPDAPVDEGSPAVQAITDRAWVFAGDTLAVPLVAHDVPLGVLVIVLPAGRTLDDDGRRHVAGLVHHAAVALANARNHRRATERAEKLATLTEITRLITSTTNSQEVYSAIARAAVTLLGGALGRVWVAHPDDGMLRIEGRHGLDTEEDRRLTAVTEVPFGRGVVGRVYESAMPTFVSDLRLEPDVLNEALTRQDGLRSMAALPLVTGDRVLGALAIVFATVRSFGSEEKELMALLANQAAIAIDNAQLLEQWRTRQSRLETLLAVIRQLSTIQPVASLLDRIVEACGRLLESDSVGIRVAEGDELVVRGTWGRAADEMLTQRLPIGQTLSACVAATGEVIVANDLATDPRLLPSHREAILRSANRAFLGVPVKIGDRLLGVLSIRGARPFSQDDVAIATAFASQAATTLENARLYQTAQQAYAELTQTQEQLVAAQRIEAVGRLAGGIAHDFNNLLTVISGRANLLELGLPGGSPLRRHVDLVQATARRATSLTQQLLAFGRRQVLQPQDVDPNRIVASMATMLKPLIGEQNELTMSLTPDPRTVRVDPAQFEQVVMNLVVNARDAMPTGGRITISTANVEVGAGAPALPDLAPGSWLRLTVTDTGVGMDAETQARIFEPFFTTREQGQGNGLGLSTVYGIVTQSDGYLHVDSGPGVGTTMAVYLRTVQAKPAEVEGEGPAPAGRGRETVLLVEDEKNVRDLLHEILESRGYRVLEAANGAEGARLWQEHRHEVDLILTDIVMPRLSGLDMVSRIRSAGGELPVLYMTGYTNLPIADTIATQANAALLLKPFTLPEITAKVREMLDAQHTPTAMAGA